MRMKLPLLFDWFGDVDRQRKKETAALSESAFDPDTAIHEDQQLARDRQAEARPGPTFLAPAGSLSELLEYLVNLLRRGTDPGIFYPDRHLAVALVARAQR